MLSLAGDCRGKDRRGWIVRPERRLAGEFRPVTGPAPGEILGTRAAEVLASRLVAEELGFKGLIDLDESGVRNEVELARPTLGVRRWRAGRTAVGGGF